jgi:hypothetical protein
MASISDMKSSGEDFGAPYKSCQYCDGTGKIDPIDENPEMCVPCNGSGTLPATCPHCGGAGRCVVGMANQWEICHTCHGSGTTL